MDEIEIVVTSTDATEAGFGSARAGADAMAGDVEGSMARVGTAAEGAGADAERFGGAVAGAGEAASASVADFSNLGDAGVRAGAGFGEAAARGELWLANLTGDTAGAAAATEALGALGVGAGEAGGLLGEAGMAAEEAGAGAEDAAGGFNLLGAAGENTVGHMSPLMMVLAAVIAILPALSAATFSAGAALLDSGAAAAVALIGLGGLKQAVDQFLPSLGLLKGAVSQVFAQDLDQPMTKFGQSMLQLEPILKTIAGSESDVIKGILDWIQSSEGMSQVQQAWAGVNTMVVESKDGFVALVRVFTEFAAAAAPSMGQISQAIDHFYEAWLDGIHQIQSNGDLTKVFEAGAQAIKAFGNVMEGLLFVFDKLATVAGGPSATAINKIGDALGAAAPLIGDFAKGIALAITAFATFAEWVSKIINFLGPFGDLLVTATGFLVALNVGLKLVASGFVLLADGIKLVGAAFAFLAANPEILAFIAVIAIVIGLAALIIQNWDKVKQFFTDMFGAIGDGAKQFGQYMADAWNHMLDGLKAAGNFVVDILNAIVKAINAVTSAITSLGGSGSGGGFQIPEIPHFATGGIGSGLAIVGEQGAELVNLPGGSSISSASDTQARLGGGQGSSQSGPLELHVAAGADGAVATMIMQLVRSGRLQIRRAHLV